MFSPKILVKRGGGHGSGCGLGKLTTLDCHAFFSILAIYHFSYFI